VHDWEVSRSIVRESPRPVILAGGLDPENVYEAVMSVAPAGVDAHSGLEDSRGRKDPEKVREFVREALRAEQDLTRMENR
jgi:phosphoribosylanthranilate isomerase